MRAPPSERRQPNLVYVTLRLILVLWFFLLLIFEDDGSAPSNLRREQAEEISIRTSPMEAELDTEISNRIQALNRTLSFQTPVEWMKWPQNVSCSLKGVWRIQTAAAPNSENTRGSIPAPSSIENDAYHSQGPPQHTIEVGYDSELEYQRGFQRSDTEASTTLDVRLAGQVDQLDQSDHVDHVDLVDSAGASNRDASHRVMRGHSTENEALEPSLSGAHLLPGLPIVRSAVELNEAFKPPHGNLNFQATEGRMLMKLHATPTAIEGLHYISGRVAFQDGPVFTERDLFTTVNGFYFAKSGRATLFGSSGFLSSHVAVEFDPFWFKRQDDSLDDEALLLKHEVMHSLGLDESTPDFGITERTIVLNSSRNLTMNDKRPRVWESELRVGGVPEPQHYQQNPYVSSPSCFFKLELSASNTRLPEESIFRTLQLSGGATSSSCNVDMVVNLSGNDLDEESVLSKAHLYELVENISTYLQMLYFIVNFFHLTQARTASRTSYVTFAMLAITDALMVFVYAISGLVVVSLFSELALAAVLKAGLCSIFEMRYVLHLRDARDPGGSQPMRTILVRHNAMYHRSFASFLAMIVVAWCLRWHMRLFWLFIFSFGVPQCVKNAWDDTSDRYHVMHFSLLFACRLFFPLYLHGYRHNLLQEVLSPLYADELYDPILCLVVCIWALVQLAVLTIQNYYGPRTGIPKHLLPEKYDYFRKVPDTLRGSDCAICMQAVTGVDSNHMLTPCDHLYHRGCLERWLQQKMQCPTCRAFLSDT